jgi:glycosyltransferase involved in cell wall biosynthesis/predicted metal-dependent phosphoesterase TrpH
MIPVSAARVDMHCHSTASEEAKLGIARSVGLPECATPPEEVYALAKRRGMDFVTITDHDTIAGCLEIADRPDVFISEELTAWFRDERHAVHVLCYGITPDDHDYLQANAFDLELCAAYMADREITCALAHPFFYVAEPLTAPHRRRLAELFAVWETRNGSRARELNAPAAVYAETRGAVGIAGSDDHAGVDIARTWTETPPASSPDEFLTHIRSGDATACGDEGSAAKWAHAAIALAARSLLGDAPSGPTPGIQPALLFEIASRVVEDGGMRGGAATSGLGSEDARALLRSWLDAVGLPSDPAQLLRRLQEDEFTHRDLFRGARRVHESRLRHAVGAVDRATRDGAGYEDASKAFLDALIPAVPYLPSTAILGAERRKLSVSPGDVPRVAMVVDAIGSMHGVTHTVERIREHGVPGYELEVIGTDSCVDRRLPAVAEVQMPFYTGMQIGIPCVPELVEMLADGRYDLLHVTAPGPAGVAAALTAKVSGLPLVLSHHTDFASYAGARSADPRIELGARAALSAFFGLGDSVLSPSPGADRSLAELGIEPDLVGRWTRGVEFELYDDVLPRPDGYPGDVKVLYAGRLTKEKGIDLLAESFLLARERDPRLHLLLAGGGPEEEALRSRLGSAATFLGWLDRRELAQAYKSSQIFLFCSRTDNYGQVIGEAQASGLPVVAVDAGGPATLIRHGITGWLCEANSRSIASAVAQFAASEALRERIAGAAREEARMRSWPRAMAELAGGYDRALARARETVQLPRQSPALAA